MDPNFQKTEQLNQTLPDAEPTTAHNEHPFAAPLQPTNNTTTNTSTITTRLVALFAGLSILCGASYLAARVFYQLFVERDTSFLFFDFSPFDLYVVISLALFAVVYFLASKRIESSVSASSDNNASSIISAIWQALLVMTVVGSVVSLIYSPISASMDFDATSENTGSLIAYEMLSALFVMILASSFLLREWLYSKSHSTLLPTIASIVLVVGVLLSAVIFILQPKQKETDDYSDYGASSSYDDDYETSDNFSAKSYANEVLKKTEAYYTINGEYPAAIADFEKTEESKLGTDYKVITTKPAYDDQIQYKRCSASGAQITYYDKQTGLTEILSAGDASKDVAC